MSQESPSPHQHHHPDPDPAGHAAPSAGGEYTCPMHPQVRQVGPGTCPLCGMALEPLDPTVDTGPNPELADMQRRFWVGLVLTVPVLALAMAGERLPWLQCALATPVVVSATGMFHGEPHASVDGAARLPETCVRLKMAETRFSIAGSIWLSRIARLVSSRMVAALQAMVPPFMSKTVPVAEAQYMVES